MADNRLEPVVLSEDERRTLENWVRRRSTAQGLALRARIVLACADGGSNMLARKAGISAASVQRIWQAFGLQPWRTETFKVSPDPLLLDKIRDVAGLYLAPPANAAAVLPHRASA